MLVKSNQMTRRGFPVLKTDRELWLENKRRAAMKQECERLRILDEQIEMESNMELTELLLVTLRTELANAPRLGVANPETVVENIRKERRCNRTGLFNPFADFFGGKV